MNKKLFFCLLTFAIFCGQALYAPPLRRVPRRPIPPRRNITPRRIVEPVVIGGGLWIAAEHLGYSLKTHRVYCVTIEIDPKCSGRWLLSPNLAVILQIPGVGNVASSEYCSNYSGQPYSFFFLAPKASKGDDILLQVIDYKDIAFNKVFNNLLKSKIVADGEVKYYAEVKLPGKLHTKVTKINGRIETQLLREHENIEVIVPGYMGTGKFTIPWLSDTTSGVIMKGNQKVGSFKVRISKELK